MGLWRCQNEKCSTDLNGRCIFDFEADKPVCPKCGGDMRVNPNAVVKVECIHFEMIGGRLGNMEYGTGVVACKPGEAVKPGTLRTSGPPAVTCPDCKRTKEWKKGMESHGVVLDDKDYEVAVDLKQQMFRTSDALPGERKSG